MTQLKVSVTVTVARILLKLCPVPFRKHLDGIGDRLAHQSSGPEWKTRSSSVLLASAGQAALQCKHRLRTSCLHAALSKSMPGDVCERNGLQKPKL